MFYRQKASLWQLADQLENEHSNHEWVDSDSVVTCMACREEFSLLNRKVRPRVLWCDRSVYSSILQYIHLSFPSSS